MADIRIIRLGTATAASGKHWFFYKANAYVCCCFVVLWFLLFCFTQT